MSWHLPEIRVITLAPPRPLCCTHCLSRQQRAAASTAPQMAAAQGTAEATSCTPTSWKCPCHRHCGRHRQQGSQSTKTRGELVMKTVGAPDSHLIAACSSEHLCHSHCVCLAERRHDAQAVVGADMCCNCLQLCIGSCAVECAEAAEMCAVHCARRLLQRTTPDLSHATGCLCDITLLNSNNSGWQQQVARESVCLYRMCLKPQRKWQGCTGSRRRESNA